MPNTRVVLSIMNSTVPRAYKLYAIKDVCEWVCASALQCKFESFVHSIIHSFIHLFYFHYHSEFHAKAPQATVSEGLAQGPYVAARVGVEPMTLRTKGADSINAH